MEEKKQKNIRAIVEYFDSVAAVRGKWRKRAGYFHAQYRKNIKFLIPENSSVLEIGCETGELLDSLKPKRGLGIDFSKKMIDIAKNKFPNLEFMVGDIDNLESLNIHETFDYIIVESVIGYVYDIYNSFSQLRNLCRPDTRVLIAYYNYLWQPLLEFTELIKLRMPRPTPHWFSSRDLEQFLYITGFDVIKKKSYILTPFYIPLISTFLNKFCANVGFLKKFSLIQIIVARLYKPRKNYEEVTCSVIVPCRNEKGNIEQAVLRIPKMGKDTEIIFVEGHSKDGTLAECERIKNKYKDKSIKIFTQDGEGKGDAVRKGLEHAMGDILMVLDGDLTVAPEDLPKFFGTIVSGKGEFLNGSRSVYKMEKQAMRSLNILGNKFFSYAFTFLLEQYLKDTLCGTKVLWREDYKKIAQGRLYFGNFDPFGDFDLLFGAAKLNLKIVEVPVHYYERKYGSTQIRRFRHGWLLLKMTILAMHKIKFV